jgi:mannosyltransferase OCH1-like enzyme
MNTIPKIIHYIWLGGGNKPESFPEIFKSWETYAPDFELRLWTEEDIKEFDLPPYFYEALKIKKFAFASDVMRCHILYRYGGIYFDIDEKLLKPIDRFVNNTFFTAYYHNRKDYFGFQLLGCVKEHYLMKEMIEYYDSYDMGKGLTIINAIFSNVLNKYKDKDKTLVIYEQYYFYPEKKYHATFDNSYAVHLGNTSWIPLWRKILYKIPYYNFFKKIFKKIISHVPYIRNKIKFIAYE